MKIEKGPNKAVLDVTCDLKVGCCVWPKSPGLNELYKNMQTRLYELDQMYYINWKLEAS